MLRPYFSGPHDRVAGIELRAILYEHRFCKAAFNGIQENGFHWSHLPANRNVIVKFTAGEVDITTRSFCIFNARPLWA